MSGEAKALPSGDLAARDVDMRLERVEPGQAILSMLVTARMANGYGICHGGFIFMLAETACAVAGNRDGRRQMLQNAQIAFVAPGRLGVRLTAEARERQRGERRGIYDATVRDAAGTVIAEFRGHGRVAPD